MKLLLLLIFRHLSFLCSCAGWLFLTYTWLTQLLGLRVLHLHVFQVLELHHIYVNLHLQEMLARIQENCARKSETYSKRLGPFNRILSCGVVTVLATDILSTRIVRSTGGLVLISTKIIALLVLPMISRWWRIHWLKIVLVLFAAVAAALGFDRSRARQIGSLPLLDMGSSKFADDRNWMNHTIFSTIWSIWNTPNYLRQILCVFVCFFYICFR